ncbi:MAG TPA: hypothetical protein VMB51_16080 [Solirubrobacteraceae bacterium]|nr:hypothetical protein [Solirubrobacteraceae bacterium]
MLVLAFASLARIWVVVLLKHVPVRRPTSCVPPLPNALLHPAAAAFEEVSYVPLRDSLLDSSGEDRGCVRHHRFVGGEQDRPGAFKFLLNAGRVGGHPGNAVDALDYHAIESTGGGVAD